jgi:hypothetical protein
MKPSYEMVWLSAFTAAIRNGNIKEMAVSIADYALERYRVRFPESKGNG